MGWRSKWTLVLDAMPFSEGKQHEAFLKDEFERRIFSTDELEQAIEQTIVDFLTEVRNIESEMLSCLGQLVLDSVLNRRIKIVNKILARRGQLMLGSVQSSRSNIVQKMQHNIKMHGMDSPRNSRINIEKKILNSIKQPGTA
jgi:hypothetical protein